jgi:DNA primase
LAIARFIGSLPIDDWQVIDDCGSAAGIVNRQSNQQSSNRQWSMNRQIANHQFGNSHIRMGLFPQSFIDDLKMQANILQVVQDRVPLRKSGATWKGLCPFHSEKTPSFHVNPDKGFFHCFGCGLGGDVVKFVELHDKLAFPEAVRALAARFGIPVPEPESSASKDEAADRDRETLLKAHEAAGAWFRAELAAPAGGSARHALEERGLTPATIEAIGYGFAPPARDALRRRLESQGFATPLLVRSGLIVQRDDGSIVDRFRNRLMVPICRESGPIIAFGGRAMEPDQQPKYLNSPETAIYTKGRTLYGLHLAKGAIRRLGYAVLVEGYFDFAQAWQAGVQPVVASSGTALTPAQARLLRRFAAKVILSFDPDSAGQGAAARSSELLVAEGFQVNVAMLPAGEDPDTFIRSHGGQPYLERLRTSRQYLEYLLDRTAADHDLTGDEGRRAFLDRMLPIAARIPSRPAREQFAERLAQKARLSGETVVAEIRRAAVAGRTSMAQVEAERGIRLVAGEVKPAEKGLIWALLHEPGLALRAMDELDGGDFAGLATAGILQIASTMGDFPAEVVPGTLLERLSTGEVELVQRIAAQPGPPAPPADCARALRRLRYERERAEVQREIDRLQELGASAHDTEIAALWARKKDLVTRIEALNT